MSESGVGFDFIHIDEAANFPIPTTMTFSNGDAQVTLDWSSGKLEVKGELSQGAIIFFEYLKPYIDDYIKVHAPYGNLEYLEWLHNRKNGKL